MKMHSVRCAVFLLLLTVCWAVIMASTTTLNATPEEGSASPRIMSPVVELAVSGPSARFLFASLFGLYPPARPPPPSYEYGYSGGGYLPPGGGAYIEEEPLELCEEKYSPWYGTYEVCYPVYDDHDHYTATGGGAYW